LSEIIVFGNCINWTAGLGVVAFDWAVDWIGPKKTVMIALTAL